MQILAELNKLLFGLDTWTMILCLGVATAMPAFAFAKIWQADRTLRGSPCFSVAFLTGTVVAALFTVVPYTTPATRFVNIVVGDTLFCSMFAWFLTGLEQFFGVRRLARFGWMLVGAAFLAYTYFLVIQDSLLARSLVSNSVNFIFCILIGVELLRHTGRRHLRTLGTLMFCYALLNAVAVLSNLTHPGPNDVQGWMHAKGAQSLSILALLIFITATGQLLFVILNGELVLRLADEATRDVLTGSLNRRGIQRALAAELNRSLRHGSALSIAVADIDFFKQINDSLGHAAGDRVIGSVARTMRDTLRDYDRIGRFGGDEFLILLPNTDAAQAVQVMDRTRELIAQSMTRSGTGRVTLSIGVSACVPGDTAEALLARADRGLYQAKAAGRNRTTLHLEVEVAVS
jgi:diguanylate cyclase (GGDEF)-like protein